VKFLCTHCDRLVEMERFALDGSSLVVTCSACGGENRATSVAPSTAAATSAPAPAAASAPPPAPAFAATPAVTAIPAPAQASVVSLRTPTVEAIARAATSAKEKPFDVPPGHCPKCISKRAPAALACPSCGLTFSTAAPETFAPSEWLQGQWVALLQSWGEDKQHEALRAEAMSRGELAPLGRLYRLRLADFPEDPYSARGRDEVLRLAVLPQTTVRQLTVDSKRSPVWQYAALSAVILACLVALFFLVRQMLAQS
jgi:hypothetical protein